MTRDILRLICKKRIYNKAKETQNNQDLVVFRNLKTCVKKQLTDAYHNYIDRMLNVDDNKERTLPKKFWSYINKS